MKKTLVITKTNCVCSLGYDHQTVVTRIYQGDHGLISMPLEPAIGKQSTILYGAANYDFKQLLGGRGWRNVDRCSLMMCLTVKSLINNEVEKIQPYNRGIVVGCEYDIYSGEFKQAFNEKNLVYINPMTTINLPANAAASWVAIKEKISGLSLTLTSGFTSGLEALNFAALAINGDRAQLVISGAVDTVKPHSVHAFATYNQNKIDSGLFNHHQAGQVIAGEGCGLLRMMSKDMALACGETIQALYLGFGMGTGGGKPEYNCLSFAIEQALKMANCQATEIDAVFLSANGHGEQDKFEGEALAEIFTHPLPAVAIKGAIGETYYGSGAIAVVMAVEALKRNQLPPTIHLNNTSAYPLCILSDKIQQLLIKRILVLSLDRTEKACAVILGSAQYKNAL